MHIVWRKFQKTSRTESAAGPMHRCCHCTRSEVCNTTFLRQTFRPLRCILQSKDSDTASVDGPGNHKHPVRNHTVLSPDIQLLRNKRRTDCDSYPTSDIQPLHNPTLL